ncbi:MAG TPA: ABC transporter permease [Soehngenia sp.]|nr:ABC transporter permease [Soehngenia sp.]
MKSLLIRNIKLFFRDRVQVFYSLLSTFIIIGLYALFLGENISSSIGDYEGTRFLIDSWIIAGLLVVTTMTTSLGALGIMVEDKHNKIIKDFASSPLTSRTMMFSYFSSSLLIALIMAVITFILGEIYIVMNGGNILGFRDLILAFSLIFLTALTSSSMMLFFINFFSSMNAFAAMSTVTGTLAGFLTGIYVPIGILPQSIQTLIKLFPLSHAALLFRNIFMAKPIEITFRLAEQKYLDDFKFEMGLIYGIGEKNMSFIQHIFFLIITAAFFLFLSIKLYDFRRTEK